ncbi:MAG TPA: hypothetical protein ENJ11_03480 [Gammaproteobacteria bacterium]|nr:hypothetical protein [Gammaproteobacteria bacterium]
MAGFSRCGVCLTCLVALFCTFSAHAGEDDYLKMLEGEAEEVSLDSSGQLKKHEALSREDAKVVLKEDWEWEGEIDSEYVPPGLAQDEFATYLKQYFYGTFVFYRKLTPTDRDRIFAEYDSLRKPRLDTLRDNILDYLRTYR